MMLTELGASSTASAARDAAVTSSTWRNARSRRAWVPSVTATVCSTVRNPARETRTRRVPTCASTTAGVKPTGRPSISTNASRSSALTTTLPVTGARASVTARVSLATTSTVSTRAR